MTGKYHKDYMRALTVLPEWAVLAHLAVNPLPVSPPLAVSPPRPSAPLPHHRTYGARRL